MSIATPLLGDSAFIKKLDEFRKLPQAGDYCVAALDIEHFKLFNEWYGWDVGNALLSGLAERIAAYEREHDMIASYFGNDDFVFVLPYDESLLYSLRNRVQNFIPQYSGNEVFRVRVGVCKICESPDATAHELCNYAQIAEVMQRGNSRRISYFDPSELSAAKRHTKIINNLEQAIVNREFSFYLQPQCNSKTRTIVGLELLARWVRPDGSVISPGEFIPAMEESGLIVELDCYLWEQACQLLAEWKSEGKNIVPVSVNVSMADIESIDVAQHLSYLIDDFELDPSYLHVEITETMAAQNPEVVAALTAQLRSRGFSIYMDDFGSGYSSLNMLKDTNIDVIKLDMKLIALNADNFEKGQRIVESIVSMAHQLNLLIVAEGVETLEQVRMLQSLDCQYVQGYKFYKPMPRQNVEALLSQPGVVCFWDLDHDAGKRKLVDDTLHDHRLTITGHAGQILVEALLAFARVNFLTGNFEVVRRDSRLPATGKGSQGNLKEYADMMVQMGIIHPDYVEDFLFRTDPDRLRNFMFKGECLRSFPVRTNFPGELEWISIGAASCKGCSSHNPWGALYVLSETVDTLPAATQKRFYDTDPLTGVLSRGKYKSDVHDLQMADCDSIVCVYVDAVGLHETNNYLGHAQGDVVLQSIAAVLKETFPDAFIYRIGGDEFVVLVLNSSFADVQSAITEARTHLECRNIDISVGVEETLDAAELPCAVEVAEKAMREDKELFYKRDGEGRQLRTLNEGLERILLERDDAIRCLAQLFPQYTGVYVVNMLDDTMRPLRMPDAFKELTETTHEHSFSKGARVYADASIPPEYRESIYDLLDFDFVRSRIWEGETITRRYVRNDGAPFTVRIMPYSDEQSSKDLTLWVFSRDDLG